MAEELELELDEEELARTTDRRINCGSGDFPLGYFINIDEDESKPAEIHCHVPPLPFDDNSLDLVWGCHFLEHLQRDEAGLFIAEAYRVLVPGGKLGLVVPDTREILRRYLAESIDAVEYPAGQWWPVADLDAVCHLFLYSTVQGSPHQWSWDMDTLGRAMAQAGFVELTELDRYRDPRTPQGAWYQVGLEGTKPLGAEGDA